MTRQLEFVRIRDTLTFVDGYQLTAGAEVQVMDRVTVKTEYGESVRLRVRCGKWIVMVPESEVY